MLTLHVGSLKGEPWLFIDKKGLFCLDAYHLLLFLKAYLAHPHLDNAKGLFAPVRLVLKGLHPLTRALTLNYSLHLPMFKEKRY